MNTIGEHNYVGEELPKFTPNQLQPQLQPKPQAPPLDDVLSGLDRQIQHYEAAIQKLKVDRDAVLRTQQLLAFTRSFNEKARPQRIPQQGA